MKNGYVTNRGKMIGGNANVNGFAYSSGSGGLGGSSRTSYGMDGSYLSNNNSTTKLAEAVSEAVDESLKDQIDKYQQWLIISGHLIYFIAGTPTQHCFATT